MWSQQAGLFQQLGLGKKGLEIGIQHQFAALQQNKAVKMFSKKVQIMRNDQDGFALPVQQVRANCSSPFIGNGNVIMTAVFRENAGQGNNLKVSLQNAGLFLVGVA